MFTKILALLLLLSTTAHAAYFPTFSINNFSALGIYNSSLPTLTNGSTSQLQVDVNGKLIVTDSSNASNWTSLLSLTTSINNKTPALGQTTMSGSQPVVLASDQTAIPVTISSSPLPTGAATSALQTTGNTSLSSIDTKLPSNLTVTSTRLLVDGSGVTQPVSGTFWQATQPVSFSSAPLPTGGATSALQTTGNTSLASIDTKTPALGQAAMAASVPVVLASNQSSIPVAATLSAETTKVIGTVNVKAPLNTTGSGSAAAATVSTVATLTAPANAVGFILMNLDTSTANIRWAVGRTASTTLGQQLQPGRDTGFVPIGANISIIAESGTQNYDVQWISQ